jgi:ABC-type uncharacterized transport system ATPase subunit
MIQAYELTKQYGRKTAVNQLSFTVRPGTVTGFLGPNGAGNPVTGLRRSWLAHQADFRIPGQRASSRMRPPSQYF